MTQYVAPLPEDVPVEEKAKGLLAAQAPWKKGVPFQVIATQAAIILALGLYMLIWPDNAKRNIRLLTGIVLMLTGLYQIVRGFRVYRTGSTIANVPFRFIGGGVMMFGGLIAILERWNSDLTEDSARMVIALTLIAAGAIGLASVVLSIRDGVPFGSLAANGVVVVLGIIGIFQLRDNRSNLDILGWIALVLGLLLAGYAYLIYTRHPMEPAPAAA